MSPRPGRITAVLETGFGREAVRGDSLRESPVFFERVTAVREALQRLAHAGVVEVRQGGATVVRDVRRVGAFDLLPRLLAPGGRIDLAVARSILDARLLVGPRVAELAATRPTPPAYVSPCTRAITGLGQV